jgi:dihydroorotate dehydrogenase
MPFKENTLTPQEFFPKCIYVSPRGWWHGSALNAVALSGPGFGLLIETGEWQKKTEPFFISIMSISNTEDDRQIDMWRFYMEIERMIKKYSHLQSLLGLQINYSCPNTGHDMNELLEKLVKEVRDHLSIFRTLGIPLVPKLNILLPIKEALEIGNDRNCDGLTLSNTIPWDDLPDFRIDRGKIFGKKYKNFSPLKARGFEQAGGYSGKELLPPVARYIQRLRELGFSKHINAGGGILHPHDIDFLDHVGASSFSLGSATFLRPWETGSIIKRAYEVKRVSRS